MLAIVLKRTNFREYDQLITFYTEEVGKTELIARGSKKITSKNSAHLEPFSVVDIEKAEGRELHYLTKVQSVNYFKNIRSDLFRSLIIEYIISITDSLTQNNEKDNRIFLNLYSLLEFLDKYEGKVNLVLIDAYVVRLFYCLGFGMSEASEAKKWIEILENFEIKDWQSINELEIDQEKYQELHRFIYNFALFQAEKKIKDWQKLAYFSEI